MQPQSLTILIVTDGIHIFVKTLTGKTYMVEVGRGYTVEMLKEEIQEMGGFITNRQKLMFGEKLLENDKILSSYNICSGSTLNLIIEVKGINRHSISYKVEILMSFVPFIVVSLLVCCGCC